MELLVALLAGFAAGIINTLAGSGSFLTLPALLLLGLPAQVANGTNRIGILLAGGVSVWTFKKEGRLAFSGATRFIAPTLLGSIAGALLAVFLPPTAMDSIVGTLMLLMLATLILQPGRWLRPARSAHRSNVLILPLFFAIGVYGGFIQAGVGLFLLSGLALAAGFDLVRANAIKCLLILLFTGPALAVFLINGQVVVRLGLLMATGQCLGAFLAARFASRSAGAERWIRLLLMVVLGAGILKLFWSRG